MYISTVAAIAGAANYKDGLLLLCVIIHMQYTRCDVCAICFMEMWEEARVTPCKHFFHGSCLRKWLSVRQVCPLCYADLIDPDDMAPEAEIENELAPDRERMRERNAELRELRAMEGARDMWPLMEQVYDNESDSESDSDSSSATEYTLASTDE
ncbi:zinc finger, C3HC4 type [Oesophagostomum dentatum]|uniref:Zinc finger, C3HC4 type n=1 Tax=Oesophagostomum dentatum TaxID=61180 RepID=A0A0B1TNT9_OESDE|nr:zinc finger, C3HC4 type [Oesophagostomum dentatum]